MTAGRSTSQTDVFGTRCGKAQQTLLLGAAVQGSTATHQEPEPTETRTS